jgi:hypothetical protein
VTKLLAGSALLLALAGAASLATAQDVYYPNCDAARAAGAAPIYQGQAGYRTKLDRDRDRDGAACE